MHTIILFSLIYMLSSPFVNRRFLSRFFTSDQQRVEFLFALYERHVVPLLPEKKKVTRKRQHGEC